MIKICTNIVSNKIPLPLSSKINDNLLKCTQTRRIELHFVAVNAKQFHPIHTWVDQLNYFECVRPLDEISLRNRSSLFSCTFCVVLHRWLSVAGRRMWITVTLCPYCIFATKRCIWKEILICNFMLYLKNKTLTQEGSHQRIEILICNFLLYLKLYKNYCIYFDVCWLKWKIWIWRMTDNHCM